MDQFSWKKIEALDHPEANLTSKMDEAAHFIKEGVESGGILVHCYAGISRSTTMIIAYLMKEFETTVHEALFEIRKSRPFANPNYGFMNQLHEYTKILAQRKQNPLAQPATTPASHSSTAHEEESKFSPITSSSPPAPASYKSVFYCRSCNHKVFKYSDLSLHTPHADAEVAVGKGDICSKYFVKQETDMLMDAKKAGQGYLICQNKNCGMKLGSYSYTGARCKCGVNVRPGLMVYPEVVIFRD